MKEKILPLVEQLNEGVLYVDPQYTVIYCNPSGAAIRNIKTSEIIGKSVLDCHSEESANKMKKIIDCLVEGKKKIVKKTVKIDVRFFDFTYQPVKNNRGKVKGVVAVSRDVTKEVHLRKSYENRGRRLKKMSITDGLTGMYNLRYFYDKLSEEMTRAVRLKQEAAVLFMDLDGFKLINDSLGHREGDKALKEIGKIIKSCIRNKVDSAFRYGGDEFAVILPGSDRTAAENVAERIRNTIATSYKNITVSIGVVSTNGSSEKELIIKADKAMYKAKNNGGNSYIYAI